MKKGFVLRLTLTALFFALGMVLPFLTGQIPQIGNMVLPMHLPVFFCALICGWQWGLPMAFLLPLLRSLIFTMPPMYPNAIAMAFELMTYALVAGLIYSKSRRSGLSLYISLISAMLAGRIVWGILQAMLLGVKGNTFTFSAFIAGAIKNAVPGIIIQLILIPAVMLLLYKTGFLPIEAKSDNRI